MRYKKNQSKDHSTIWAPRHQAHFATELQNTCGFGYIPKQVSRKYQRLKAEYLTFKQLQAQTGHGWDPIVGTVIVPDEF